MEATAQKSSFEIVQNDTPQDFNDVPEIISQEKEHKDTSSIGEAAHPVLQLASTALNRGLTSAELTDVVPPPATPTQNVGNEPTLKQESEQIMANVISIKKVVPKDIAPNTLEPRQQEEEDEDVILGFQHLLNNRFMSAKRIFEKRSDRQGFDHGHWDPLYALALSSMAFLKAIMTSAEQDHAMALDALNTTYDLAKAELDATKKPSAGSGYFSGYYDYLRQGAHDDPLPISAPPKTTDTEEAQYPPNGVLRAHVLKAECCLQIAILQLLQESVMGYVKCGLNLRRAYSSYSFVWQEYQRMGSEYDNHMDRDTISGVQFGIGSVHLVLSALPAKILKAISAFGWKPDKQLGFSLLQQCVESKRVRSPMATMVLLAYYCVVTSYAPQILSEVYVKTATEALLEAQSQYPNSALYLFFAGHIARLGLDLPLSTQSYLYAAEISRGEWAEVAVTNSCRYEIAINHMVTGNWAQAASVFDQLCEQGYWSAAFCKYAQGACLEMIDERTEAILAFAEVPGLVVKKLGGRMSDIDGYVLRKVQTFQDSGYQDLDMYVPILEFMCIWNLFHVMDHKLLEELKQRVEKGLETIQAREKHAYEARMRELAPETSLPDYFDERAILLLTKASIQNVIGQANETALHLNWIIDHKDQFAVDPWVVPYALWEAGVSSWKLDQKNRSRHIWEKALNYSKYHFEHRLAVRLNLTLSRAEELGFTKAIAQPIDDKKRFSILVGAAARNSSSSN
ncbi:Tetratricopeptide repeat protein 39B [Apophysomyces sp. BC1034]|nr:Tetratricopeptide repeat protein 39B [Apophysomyces sp. BC1015]KAG0180441.1 Tetratricopeptide repeat protein 39B [Apophysomyces sp. BC1021]KAG0187511.1 Tetratricopeptide repeat protein 39B [Apophysomyces sp. BC1034]